LGRIRKAWNYLSGKSRTRTVTYKSVNKGILDIKERHGLIFKTDKKLIFSKNGKKVFDLRHERMGKKGAHIAKFKSLDPNKGYGKEAMKYFLKKMKERGKDKVSLTFAPTEDLKKSALFYTKFGFKHNPKNFNKIFLDNLQKLDIDKLALSKPNLEEAKKIADAFFITTVPSLPESYIYK